VTTDLVSKKDYINNSTELSSLISFIDSVNSIYDLPFTWEERIACYVEDEDILYVSAGPMVWVPFFMQVGNK